MYAFPMFLCMCACIFEWADVYVCVCVSCVSGACSISYVLSMIDREEGVSLFNAGVCRRARVYVCARAYMHVSCARIFSVMQCLSCDLVL